jgi:hypothetical protein
MMIDRTDGSVRSFRPELSLTLDLRDRLWLIVAILGGLIVRLPFIRTPLNADEGGYAYLADRWLRGDGTLYQDLWISRPQGIVAAYALILRVLGADATAIRIGSWIVVMLTLLLVWWIARSVYGRQVATVAALFFGLLSGSPLIQGFTANAEVFEAFPAAGVVALLLYALRRDFPTLARSANDHTTRALVRLGNGNDRRCSAGAWLQGRLGPVLVRDGHLPDALSDDDRVIFRAWLGGVSIAARYREYLALGGGDCACLALVDDHAWATGCSPDT